jgi:hypothetical protein
MQTSASSKHHKRRTILSFCYLSLADHIHAIARYIRTAGGVSSYMELPPRQQDTKTFQSRVTRKLAEDQPVVAPSGVQNASLSKPHLHELTAVLPFSTPFSNALMISTADAAGVIKIWKVEG